MSIKWDEVKDEALGYFQKYLQIDTTNPPGNEGPAADFLTAILKRAGLSVQAFEAEPGRPSIICRLKGDGSKGAIVLLHHMDVVPVEREKWSVDPFGGDISDGFIWGRGSVDMKGLGIMELMAFLLIHRLDRPLKRELIYMAVPDEETGGGVGAEWLAKNHADKCRAEFMLNEGGAGWKFGGRSGFHFGIGEKGPLWLRVKTEGPPGHGSVPLDDNAILRLNKALARIAEYKPPLRIVDEIRGFLEKAGLGRDIDEETLAGHEIITLPAMAAMFHNTISLTGLKAGQKENVIPSTAEATLDCRLLPGEDQADFIKTLEEIIGDPEVRIETIEGFAASSSSADSGFYLAMEQVLNEVYPGVPVFPTISAGFTDSRCFRVHGTQCYGLLPLLVERAILATAHGHDERLPLEEFEKGIRVIFEVIERLNQ
jgi:acetylornithine deacetylase/succinyl-diaminopimelate desuccinylase-like protein